MQKKNIYMEQTNNQEAIAIFYGKFCLTHEKVVKLMKKKVFFFLE